MSRAIAPSIAPCALLLLSACAGQAQDEPLAQPRIDDAQGASWSGAWGAAPSPAAPSPSTDNETSYQVASFAPAPAMPRGGGASAPAREVSPRIQLERQRVEGLQVADEESLRAVTRRLQDLSGVAIVVHPSAEEAAFDAGVVFNLSLEHAMLAKDVLNLIVGQAGEDVLWTVRHGTVLVTTLAKVENLYVLATHDIRTLTTPRTDFLGPRIDRIRLLDDMEDEDGGGPFGGVGERVSQYSGDDVLNLVQESVAQGTWETDGVSIDVHEGLLIVKHTREVQQRIRFFLAALGS